jgi:hypothetical protein
MFVTLCVRYDILRPFHESARTHSDLKISSREYIKGQGQAALRELEDIV